MKTISQKVMAASGAVLLLCTAIAGAGLWVAAELTKSLKSEVLAAEILRRHMDADMMHDALRADAFSALLASDPRNGVSIAQVRADLAEHTKTFQADIDENQKSIRNPVVQKALNAVRPLLDSYIEGAGHIVDLAANDPVAAQAALPAFLTQFSDLETAMAQATELISAQSRSTVVAAENQAQFASRVMVGLLILSAGFGGALVFLARRTVASPIVNLASGMRALAAGDTEIVLKGAGRSDEIGDISRAVRTFQQLIVDKAQREAEAVEQRRRDEHEARTREAEAEAELARRQAIVVEALATGLERLADGDLSHRIAGSFCAEYDKLRTDFNAAIAKLQDTMQAIATSASGIRGSTAEISSASNDLSRRTEQQAARLEEAAAAIEQISTTLGDSASGAKETHTVVTASKLETERSGAVVSEAIHAMGEIEASSQEISQIIGVIDEIAFQTNLLALNAGVEAARAGDAGRGFAVVASEVRALAQRSAEAAKEIKTLISTSSSQVERGVDLVGQAGDALYRITAQIGSIDGLVTKIAASSAEQSAGLQQINSAVHGMDQNTQQNAAMVEQSSAATLTLRRDVENLFLLIEHFKLQAADSDERRAA